MDKACVLVEAMEPESCTHFQVFSSIRANYSTLSYRFSRCYRTLTCFTFH